MSENTVLTLPVICTRGMLVFPENRLTLDVGRPVSLKAIDLAMEQYDNNIVFVSQIDPVIDHPTYHDVYHVGTICKVDKKIRRDSAGTIKLTVIGEKRVSLTSLEERDGAIFSTVEIIEDMPGDKQEEIALVRKTMSYFEQVAKRGMPNIPRESMARLTTGVSASLLADTLGQHMPLELDKKQAVLRRNRY